MHGRLQFAILLYTVIGTVLTPSVADAAPLAGRKGIKETLASKMQITYEVVLDKDEMSVFVVNGNGRSDLDCYLYDDQKNLVGKDDDNTDTCVVRVMPDKVARYTFVVKNVGEKSNSFVGSIF